MSKDSASKRIQLFSPYYINQSRLLDIYSILNGGYSEYAEITTSINSEKTKGTKADGQASGGFKLVNLGGNLLGEQTKTDGQADSNHEKKVQTITSILSLVRTTLAQKGYLRRIDNAKPGDYVCIPVNLQINSIKSLLTEASEILKLSNTMSSLGATIRTGNADAKKYDAIIKSIQTLFAGEEILFETDYYAIIGNIADENLYQGTRADIVNVDLTCLAQVKRVFPDGTELMKNTIFTKIKDANAKVKFIESMSTFTSGNVFNFEATAVSAIYGKPVYQLEIIALYQ